MKKFGTNKRNPNPPWPDEQAVVIIPPGSNPDAVGMGGQRLYNMQNSRNANNMAEQQTVNMSGNSAGMGMNENMSDSERMVNGENYQIMGEMPMPTDRIAQSRIRNGLPVMPNHMNGMQNNMNMSPQNGRCDDAYITGYLCGQTGKYVRLEFLFGEQTHVEKTGVLREVGRNYIVMQEMGTNNMIVSPLDKIKFINIYNVNNDDM